MKTNVEKWYSWAMDMGYDMAIEEIFFLIGSTKTTRWAVVAFSGNSKHVQLTFRGNFGLPAAAAFHIDYQTQYNAVCTPRIGPSDRPRMAPGNPVGPLPLETQEPSASAPQTTRRGKKKARQNIEDVNRRSGEQSTGYPARYPSDQCMFMNYLKLKKRPLFLPDTIEAAAEPQDPSVDRDSDSAQMLIEEVPARETVCLPNILIAEIGDISVISQGVRSCFARPGLHIGCMKVDIHCLCLLTYRHRLPQMQLWPFQAT